MTSGVGLMTATHLLLKLAVNHTNEDDLRRVAECEARLMLAGFGNYHDLRKPGEITKKIVLGIGEKLNNVDGTAGKRIFCDLDEQLRLAGFDNPFDADNIKEIVTILRPYVARYSGTTTNWVPDETTRNTVVPRPRQHASTLRVGILTAVNILYELEMGIISDFELRQLGEYEINLKTGNDVRAEVSSQMQSETRVPVEDNQWPPPTLGTITNSVLTDLSTKLALAQDLAAKDLMLEKTEKLLQQAGFGNHYGDPKIEELVNELEDLRRARGKAFKEKTCDPDANSKESEVSVKATPDVSSEVTIKTCKIQKKIEKLEKKLKSKGFGEHCSTVQIQELRKELENLKMTQDKPKDSFEAVEVSPKASSETTTDTSVKTADTLTGVPLNTSEEKKSEVKRQKPILGPGLVTVSYLLCQLECGDITEDDRRKLAQYEERLKAAGFGSDVKTESAGALGQITNDSIIEYNTKLAETSDIEARNLISDEYEEHLKQAGFYEYYSAAQFEEIWTWMAKDLRKAKDNDSSDLAETSKGASTLSTEVLKKEGPVVSAEVSSESSKEAASIEVLTTNGEASKVSDVVTDKTGIAAASYLLYKAKSGQVSNDELKKLSEQKVEVAGPAGPSVANENAAEVAREDAIAPAKRKLLLKFDSLVELARPCQYRQTEYSSPKDLRDEQTSNAGAATLEEVPNSLSKTGLSSAFHIVLKVQKGQASEDEINKLRQCEEKLMLAEIRSGNARATASEPLPALGTITFNLLRKFSEEMKFAPAGDRETIKQICNTYVNKLKFAGFNTINETEKMWKDVEYVFSSLYKATEISTAASNEKVQSYVKTSKVMAGEISNKVPDKDVSEVSDKAVNEKKEELLENEHGDEALVESPNLVLNKNTDKMLEKILKEVMFEIACEKAEVAGKKASVVVKDNIVEKGQAVVETNAGCKSNENATDEARESTSEAADKTYRLVKFYSPAPPVRPSKTEDTNPKDPRITNVPTNLKPERKIVVARRRLKEQAPIDWFTTDGSKPPPDFDDLYTRLYSELPLSCRAYAFSTRLKGIKEQLKNINEPLACLLRKDYNNVVEAFDRYLSTVQKRASMEPTNNRWTRVQPNQEKWRHQIIFQLFMSLDNLPGGLRIRPLDFSQPLTIRASFVAERLKMVEVKLGRVDAQQALLLSKEFSAIVASFATRWGRPLDCPIPGEPYDDRTSRPLPDELEHLRQDKNRAEREYKWFPSPANKQVRDQLTNKFKRQLAIWKDSQV